MRTLALALSAAFIAASALGQSGVADRVKQRARRLSDENNARQGVSQPAPAVPPQPPPDPVLLATRENIANLQRDFAGLKAEPAQKQQLVNDLTAAPHGAKPSKSSIAKLADDLTAALAGKPLSAAQQSRLAQDVHAIFNSSHLTPAQQQTIFDSVQTVLKTTGVPADLAGQVVTDVRMIATETR